MVLNEGTFSKTKEALSMDTASLFARLFITRSY